jgi:Flp pilus assembly secretin CpaC
LGYLFTSTEVEHSNTELIAFITPIVVENTAAADEVNAKDLGRLHELRNNQFKDGQHGSSNELVKPTNEILPNPPPPPPADGNPPAPNPPAPGPGSGSS